MRNASKSSPFKLVDAGATNTNGTASNYKPAVASQVLVKGAADGDLLSENQAAAVPDHEPIIACAPVASVPSPMKLNK